jgi:hypothetical protein
MIKLEKNKHINFNRHVFSGGEVHVAAGAIYHNEPTEVIEARIQSSDDLMELLIEHSLAEIRERVSK